ncbi:flagellar basal body rod protein FlgC [Thiospirochaeta perfilievii]|uniref:Flagellar basal-body rod protein FlgC n=1 Tax=Thiospirochaeta perfilievii TaxID=252967 RepID=A0A5C1QAA8_9SPIO|nr:flagellar basal body rod protein FlgC [Thiospirochaeta perfilievii]QEN03736.1 flagellar basal body rod protein FlgC [Thiospirochaeta perfilievii]
MGMFSSINTAASGLTAQRLRLDVISDNIANAETTRTSDGGPYRRSRVVLKSNVEQPYWNSPFQPKDLDNGVGKGVKVEKIEEDMDAELRQVWDPTHPDAIQVGPQKGYVLYPNVNPVTEMVDMISASRAYEANVSVIEGTKAMFNKALEIGR